MIDLELGLEEDGDGLDDAEAHLLIVDAQALDKKVDEAARELNGRRGAGAHQLLGGLVEREVSTARVDVLVQLADELVRVHLAIGLDAGGALVELELGALMRRLDEYGQLLAHGGLDDGRQLGLEQEAHVEGARREVARLGEYELAVLHGEVEVAAEVVLTLQLLDEQLDLGVAPRVVRAVAEVEQVGEGLAERRVAEAHVLEEGVQHVAHVDVVRLLELDLAQRLGVQVLVVVDEHVDGLVVDLEANEAGHHPLARLHHALAVVAALLGGREVLAQYADELALLLLVDELLHARAARAQRGGLQAQQHVDALLEVALRQQDVEVGEQVAQHLALLRVAQTHAERDDRTLLALQGAHIGQAGAVR